MSLEVSFTGADDGDDGPFHLCSASEWLEFARWAAGRGDALEALARDGKLSDTRKLRRCSAPDAPPVVAELLSLVGVGDPQETVTVS